ncbi:MAG: methyltransferase [Treponema sp.]|jgi:23S rRNA (uracil1939-C5)-methyltransferase|nr:methyltransferase [Treponema sp.]
MISDVFTAKVESIASTGAGVLSKMGQRVFVDGVAPCDVVRARITEEHRNWATAEVVDIVEPSLKRRAPLCPLFGICGGCSLQHLVYDAQIKAKATILKDAFIHIGGLSELPELIIKQNKENEFGYRNRVRFHVGRQGQIGFKAKRSEEIIPLYQANPPEVKICPVADTGINAFLKSNPSLKREATVYSFKDIFLIEGEKGKSRGKVRILDRDIILDAGVFFQSNALMLEELVKDILSLAGEAKGPYLDVYSGVGTFAAFLQDFSPALDIIEEDKTALAIARENIKNLGEIFAVSSDSWARIQNTKKYGLVIVDPPRQGLSSFFRNRLCKDHPPVIIYVSCNPATLARDSKAFVQADYRLASLSMFDFYPQTAHIESLAVFC